MAKKKDIKTETTKEEKHRFGVDIENKIVSIVVDNEYDIEKMNRKFDNNEFESLLDLIECKRNEKDYEWMSDIFLPEFPSIILTDASGWASQYFQSRDFVEVYLGDDEPENKAKSQTAKKVINKVLNDKEIHHYHKYIRARLINALAGQVFAVCYWNQELRPVLKGYKERPEILNVDINGNEIVNPDMQTPAVRMNRVPVFEDEPIVDRFNYEVVDPRNVFYNNKYCYSIQEKDWITIRSEKTYEELRANEKTHGYFNLNLVKEALKSGIETETSKETYNKSEKTQKVLESPIKPFDILERFGKFWCVVEEKTPNGYPIKMKSGYDQFGNIDDKAELIETIIATALVGSQKILIRFQPTPYIDSKERPYKPIIRGWCYIHPTKDSGLSDGKYNRELQVALNDTFNMSNDRVKLATLPTLKGRKYSLEDNTTIYIEPGHIMELEDPQADLTELKIEDNIQGALQQIQMLRSMEEQVSSIYPTTMGALPEYSSTTATAIAGAEQRTNTRSNYKSLTFEYTFLTEFYWMILQMIYRFAHKDTAIKLMGRDVMTFDPDADYTYTPISSNIELEYSKFKKIQMWDQILGRIVNVPNPKTPILINYIIGEICGLMGGEYSEFKNKLLDERAPVTPGGNPPTDMTNRAISPMSNQNSVPMSNMEQDVRGM